jgi:predicted ATPase
VRLVKAEVSGFGRLAEGKINLDHKVVAIVGPNEAGKTTLLEALAYIDNKLSLSVSERSRGRTILDSHVVVKVQYLLDDEDRSAVGKFDLEEPPTSIWLSRTAGPGDTQVDVEPPPRRSIAAVPGILASLSKVATPRALANLDPPVSDDDVEVDQARQSLRPRITELVDRLMAVGEDARVAVETCKEELAEGVSTLRTYEVSNPIVEALEQLNTWAQLEPPGPAVSDALWHRSPDIVLFDENSRTLLSTYAISDDVAANPPIALANLCNVAKLDLRLLRAAIASGDEGERETLIHGGNQVLAAKFKETWKQSDIAVHLKIEGEVLAIRIMQNSRRITKFDERSAGLRMFVALVAFLATRDTHNPPVLLIDEAETHLHIDAQQDLVNTFMTQTQASKIIYTTHSPACLPPDLGSNIRAVLPDKTNGDVSRIESSFWHSAAGYSPLMLAMGAGAAAFSAARFVVLAEGASEMLMLPSLVRRAIKVDDLQYQVAPGLSEVPTAMYPELDLEGARVAYIVDGDGGGIARRNALIRGGVPQARIVTLEALTLENLLEPGGYLKTVATLLAESNPGASIPTLPELPDPGETVWPTVLDLWASEQHLKLPGKRVVASRLVEDELAVPSAFGTTVLKKAHDDLIQVLGLPT